MIRQRKLKRILEYKPETGEFIGGNSINVFSRGYLRMTIDNKPYSLQRLAWIYCYGDIPQNATIGFKDKNKTNLKIENLYMKIKTIDDNSMTYFTTSFKDGDNSNYNLENLQLKKFKKDGQVKPKESKVKFVDGVYVLNN